MDTDALGAGRGKLTSQRPHGAPQIAVINHRALPCRATRMRLHRATGRRWGRFYLIGELFLKIGRVADQLGQDAARIRCGASCQQ